MCVWQAITTSASAAAALLASLKKILSTSAWTKLRSVATTLMFGGARLLSPQKKKEMKIEQRSYQAQQAF
jgi:hypothetical protein